MHTQTLPDPGIATTTGTPDPGCLPLDCPTLVPEPASVLLLAVPLALVAVLVWRRRRRA